MKFVFSVVGIQMLRGEKKLKKKAIELAVRDTPTCTEG